MTAIREDFIDLDHQLNHKFKSNRSLNHRQRHRIDNTELTTEASTKTGKNDISRALWPPKALSFTKIHPKLLRNILN